MSVTPVRESINSGSGEPRYGRQTLRSISCPLVSAVLVLRLLYREDRDPLTL
jgi:hypothetical protein